MNPTHNEPTIASRVAFEGRIINVRVDTIQLPAGAEGTREVVEHSECVCIVPLDQENNVIMVRQYRKPSEQFLLEVPAGGVEMDEHSREAVLRELQEETGYSADDLHHLSSFWMSPGFCTELMHAYLATGLRTGTASPDEDENIQVVKVPMGSVADMIRSGEIRDAKSIASLLMVLHLRPERGGEGRNQTMNDQGGDSRAGA